MGKFTHEEEAAKRRSLDRIAWVLDRSIRVPGSDFRFGLDPIIGLFPGVGDAIGAILSSYIMLEAVRMGATISMLVRMALNIAAETIVGVVPVAGNLFDAWWKANTRNVHLLEQFLDDPDRAARSAKRSNWLIAAVILGILLLIALAVVMIGIVIILIILQLFAG